MLLIIRKETAEKSRGLLGALATLNNQIEAVCILGEPLETPPFPVETVYRSLSSDDPRHAWPVISACEDLMEGAGIPPEDTILVSESDDARMFMASLMLNCHYISIEEVTQLYGG